MNVLVQTMAMVAALFFLAAAGLVVLRGAVRLERDLRLFVAILALGSGLYAGMLFVEWSGFEGFDAYEDFFGALVPLLWAFFFYAQFRSLSQADLADSEQRYRTLFDQSNDAILIHAASRILEVNSRACELLGRSRDDLVGMSIEKLVDDSDRENVSCRVRGVEQGGAALFETRFRRADGGVRHVEISSSLIDARKGVIQGVVRDVTERKLAEEEMRRLRNLLRGIIDSMSSFLVAVDAQGRLMQLNERASALGGLAEDEALGRPADEVFAHLTALMPMVFDAMNGREARHLHKRLRMDKDKKCYENIGIYPLLSEPDQGAVIRIDDVTELVLMEEMMVQTEKMLSIGGVAAGMAHEINNPLAGIMGSAQNVARRLSSDIGRNRDAARECGLDLDALKRYMGARRVDTYLEQIVEAGRRASRIVRSMLSFSRESGAERAVCDVAGLLDETLELIGNDYDLQKRYDFKKIGVERDYDPQTPAIAISAGEMQQVFFNLFKNAAEAMAGEPGLPPRLALRVRPEDDWVRIEVADNGPGMDEETRRSVLEPFFTTKGSDRGTGLGLSVSYFIVVEHHGGRMRVESAPGKGATFILHLPRASSLDAVCEPGAAEVAP